MNDKHDNRKVLFSYGEWTIRKWNVYEGSFVRHEKCGVGMEYSLIDGKGECEGVNCESIIPKEVRGLWYLDNFDRIPTLIEERRRLNE